MDVLLARLGSQAMNLALRNGLILGSSYAIGQCSRLLKTVDDRKVRSELKSLQDQLDSKIKILSPVIDLIEFKSGRGNIFLQSAVPLAKSLHRDIVSLGQRLENAAFAEEGSRRLGRTATTAAAHHAELLDIIREIKALLARIEREIPILQLAITASGETLSSSLPSGISPSRFLQASFFLNLGDTQYASDPTRPVQIGPMFCLSLYMLFIGHSNNSNTNTTPQRGTESIKQPATPDPSRSGTPLRENEPYGFGEGERRPIWQEVLHKARVRLCRIPLGWYFDHNHGYVPPSGASPEYPMIPGRPDEYSYHLEIVEDLDDGRVHDEDAKTTRAYNDIPHAGIRESIPIHQIAKIFYTDSGRILNIGNADEAGSNPVLLLKRDATAPTPVELNAELMTTSKSMGTAAGAIEDTDSITSDEQDEIDRQLREESQAPDEPKESSSAPEKQPQHPLALHLPAHLDHEWLALEVFEEDDDDDDDTESSDGAEDEIAAIEDSKFAALRSAKQSTPSSRSPSMDANLLAQVKTLSLRSSTDLTTTTTTTTRTPPNRSSTNNNIASPSPPHSSSQIRRTPTGNNFNNTRPAASSPFGTITSSLSLMEMLIRLTSLQEFQQAAHLSIPDYILSFFLDETSTTGLRGEERWRARDEAKRRVGFDPYTDTPSK